MDGCKLDVLWFSIAVYILLHFSFSTSHIHASGSGFQTGLFGRIPHVYLLECTITETSNLFVVDIFQLTPNLTKLAGLIRITKECKTNRTFVSCVFHETPPAVVLSAVITDLEEGETRSYQCTANSYERADNYKVSITRNIRTTTWTAATTWTADSTSTAPGGMTGGTVGIGWAIFAYGGASTLLVVLLTLLARRKCCKGTKRAQDVIPTREEPAEIDPTNPQADVAQHSRGGDTHDIMSAAEPRDDNGTKRDQDVTPTREEPVELDLTAPQADEVQHSRGGDTQDIMSAAEPRDDNEGAAQPPVYEGLKTSEVGLASPYAPLQHYVNLRQPSGDQASQYEELMMREVGLSSPYAELQVKGKVDASKEDQASKYEELRMREVGLSSPYTELQVKGKVHVSKDCVYQNSSCTK